MEAINTASAREKSIRHGHPSTLHLWWARRPLAAARAVIFAQMVDDPSSSPDLFPTASAQENERQRLFKIIEDIVVWENSTNEKVLACAREEIWQSWRRTCAENSNHPRANELFDPQILPGFHDPFAGGGALPLEAQRLGLDSYASDLNPVAVLINKAMIEIPSKFADKPPVNAEARSNKRLFAQAWRGAKGLADDVRYYGRLMREEAEKRIGHLYPKIEINARMVKMRPDLKAYTNRKLPVIAWLWSRTVKSPNPAASHVDVPLISTFMISAKAGKEAYVDPIISDGNYRFTVKVGKPKNPEATKSGTKLARGANFKCLMSGTPITGEHIKAEGKAGRMGVRLMAIVAEGDRGRVYLDPTPEQEAAAQLADPTWRPDGAFVEDARAFTPCIYGIREWQQLFTNRQLVALSTLSALIEETKERVRQDCLASELEEGNPLRDGGTGAAAYAEAVAVYLTFALSKQADLGNSFCRWEPIAQCPRQLFGRQAIPMIWDFAEANPLGNSSGGWVTCVEGISKAFAKTFEYVAPNASGKVHQANAGTQSISLNKVVSTDPPYYDNVPYADLSDFFYVWMRRSLKEVFPDLFTTLAVPKADELVAFGYRHGSKAGAEAFFLKGMTNAMKRLADQAHPAFPITIYYAFKQSESDASIGTMSTGWETFLDAVIRAGLMTSGTWPLRTENDSRMRGQSSNALATSIVLVCRARPIDAPTATRREFVTALKAELPKALAYLQRGNIAPVDLAQAAIGPGMAIYTRFARVLDVEGEPLKVRDALALINQTLDEALAEQEGDFDASTRWALTWFDQSGFTTGEYGVAEQLSKSKNTTVSGMVEAGIIESKRGKVRLLKPEELTVDWDPTKENGITHWEIVNHLIRVLTSGGESAAAELIFKLGRNAETARELCYRLYTICERKKRPTEGLAYNGLVQSWPEIIRIASQARKVTTKQASLFNTDKE